MSRPTPFTLLAADVATSINIAAPVIPKKMAHVVEQPHLLLQLEQIIETITADLQRYAQKENANQFYIDRQNKLIAELVAIYNNIEGLQLFHFWQSVEKEMTRIASLDPQVCGYTISIRTRPTGDQFSFIQINSFDK